MSYEAHAISVGPRIITYSQPKWSSFLLPYRNLRWWTTIPSSLSPDKNARRLFTVCVCVLRTVWNKDELFYVTMAIFQLSASFGLQLFLTLEEYTSIEWSRRALQQAWRQGKCSTVVDMLITWVMCYVLCTMEVKQMERNCSLRDKLSCLLLCTTGLLN